MSGCGIRLGIAALPVVSEKEVRSYFLCPAWDRFHSQLFPSNYTYHVKKTLSLTQSQNHFSTSQNIFEVIFVVDIR